MLRSIQITLQFISHSISFSFKISRDRNQDNTMGLLYEQLENALLPGMIILEPLRLLYEWIEDNKTYTDRSDGIRFGSLFSEQELKSTWTEKERYGGTNIEFVACGNSGLEYWFGHNRKEVLNRLCVFARTGFDGSMAAFWLDDNHDQKIVHMGSGSGSTLVCVLAEDCVDFLRLLAIGYDEICWSEEFSQPPNTNLGKGEQFIHPHIDFQEWVSKTFNVTIPKNALEIIKFPSEMDDSQSHDPFWQWIESVVE